MLEFARQNILKSRQKCGCGHFACISEIQRFHSAISCIESKGQQNAELTQISSVVEHEKFHMALSGQTGSRQILQAAEARG